MLGYLPTELAGGEITLDAQAAHAAVKTIADAMELGSVEAAAAGIVNIVNENMFGALRLVSVQQGFDPRDFALVAFGGAGPLHANALGKLTGAWPVIVPPSPGVLCAYGDATTMVRDDAARTYIRTFGVISDGELLGLLHELAEAAAATVEAQGVPPLRAGHHLPRGPALPRAGLRDHRAGRGRGVRRPRRRRAGRAGGRVRRRAPPPLLVPARGQRARAGQRARHRHRPAPGRRHGPAARRRPRSLRRAGPDDQDLGRRDHADTAVYDRTALRAGNVVTGPAIITEMDSTTLVLPGHAATVHPGGSLLIRPTEG